MHVGYVSLGSCPLAGCCGRGARESGLAAASESFRRDGHQWVHSQPLLSPSFVRGWGVSHGVSGNASGSGGYWPWVWTEHWALRGEGVELFPREGTAWLEAPQWRRQGARSAGPEAPAFLQGSRSPRVGPSAMVATCGVGQLRSSRSPSRSMSIGPGRVSWASVLVEFLECWRHMDFRGLVPKKGAKDLLRIFSQ